MKTPLNLFAFFLLISVLSINAQGKNPEVSSQKQLNQSTVKQTTDNQVKVYYFHATRRCVTCQAIEKVAKETIEEKYGNDIEFIVLNREKEENSALVRKFKISGQTLLVVKGDKIVNLTNDAFLNARTYPEKLKAKITETINTM
ncbi:MAG: thioredoxin family protein [Bacteroidales bacterium]|nr:thioredoxin family protein [Bacteroidales bacterium]